MLFSLTLMGCLLDIQESTVKSRVLQNYIFKRIFLKMAPICHLPWTYRKPLVPFSSLRVAYRAGQTVRPRNKSKMDISLTKANQVRLIRLGFI